MARRSSSSRWSRPATGKQIATLKARGNYDGKYYSVGRASRIIGGASSSSSSAPSGGSLSGGSAYSPFAALGLGTSGLLFGGTDRLDALLESALGVAPQSPLAASESGPMDILSELLEVPDDIDSLVQAALGMADPQGQSATLEEEPVASVLYTIRSDDSDPADPRIVVEAEVVHDSAFVGQPSLQVRFIGNAAGSIANGSSEPVPQTGMRSVLGYRPAWTPVLIRTPVGLAEQMRVRWVDAMRELNEGVDPRMTTFLGGLPGMEPALAVLTSTQTPASKFVLLQGLLDPEGLIQFKGLGLDAATFAEQIRMASGGDEEALSWLETVQREQVLTSLAEVSGTDLAAEADYMLTGWCKQGVDLIEAVTTNSEDAEFDFSSVRAILTMQADRKERQETERLRLLEMKESNPETAKHVNRWLKSERFSPDSESEYGLLEDWFFEETRIYLHARFRRSLPGLFVAALTARSDMGSSHLALAGAVRRMASASSTDPSDYSEDRVAVQTSWNDQLRRSLGVPPRCYQSSDRIQRIVQAVCRVTEESAAAGDDELGTLVVAHEVLSYAKWKRDEFRAGKQAEEAERHNVAAVERSRKAEKRAEAARGRNEEERKAGGTVGEVDQVVQRYARALASFRGSINIQDPLPDVQQAAAIGRVEQAAAREAAAGEWLNAAEERGRWAATEAAVAANSSVEEKLFAERDAAIAEQSAAKTERKAAQYEQDAARSYLTQFAEARSRYEELIRPVSEENQKRLEVEAERRRQEAEERRQRAEETYRKQEAANRRQEELNQRQQERANAAKNAIGPEMDHLLALPMSASIWRRKRLAATRVSLEQTILKLQSEISVPIVPPSTRSKTWPTMLSPKERYLGTVRKIADYGAFVTLPTGTDGLLRGPSESAYLTPGQLVIVEIVYMPNGKPIVLKRVLRRA